MPTEIKNQVKSFFRKNYKTKTITQMATELSGKQPGNSLNTNVRSLFTRFKDFLIEKNIKVVIVLAWNFFDYIVEKNKSLIDKGVRFISIKDLEDPNFNF